MTSHDPFEASNAMLLVLAKHLDVQKYIEQEDKLEG